MHVALPLSALFTLLISAGSIAAPDTNEGFSSGAADLEEILSELGGIEEGNCTAFCPFVTCETNCDIDEVCCAHCFFLVAECYCTQPGDECEVLTGRIREHLKTNAPVPR